MDMLLSSPTFVFIQVLNSISLGMNLFIIAAGLSLIFGVLRVINFAHGVFYMFGAYIMYSISKEMELGFVTGVVAAGLGLSIIAIVIERGLFQWLYDKEHLMQLLLTFAIVLIMGDLAKIIWGTDQLSVSYPEGLSGATNLGVTFYPTYRLTLAVIGPLIFIGLFLMIERTRWGRLTRAATQDMEMLSALGINVPVIYVTIFLIGSALAGIGGALAAPINSPTPGMDATIIVECFVIVIIGGLGSLWGSFVGALVYGFVFNFGSVIVPNWQDVFAFLLLMVVLLWRPWGLFGKPEREGQ
ncbi:branched-chain amino acid ABC transporter permease [Ponticaulis sp.]|uniref:branched-chain amino acid ABC transporter permease n=1 Tax=Ponticaulis sp. TaxID=2020902 RepID=UPI000C64A9D6|nr:branched-chain amino acid ABC transporter permease [Ponticaulis sp.]MBN06156.1 branched-chain amino acid ABC transporter permease [Ponticaulis sp.]